MTAQAIPLKPLTFDDLPSNPYMAILLDPQKDETEKALEIRAHLDTLPQGGTAVYLAFREALRDKKAALEQQVDVIYQTPSEDIHALIQNGRDFASPMRAPQLRQSFNTYFTTANHVIAAFDIVKAGAQRLERMLLVLATAEAGAEHSDIAALSSSSVKYAGEFNTLNYDLYLEKRNFTEGIMSAAGAANEVAYARTQHDRNIYRTTVTGHLSQGQGEDVTAPSKATFAQRKQAPKP